MIVFKRFINKICLYCGYFPLELWAFTFDLIEIKNYKETGRKFEGAEPVLVCTDAKGRRGCGTIFDPMEYDLEIKDLIDYRTKKKYKR